MSVRPNPKGTRDFRNSSRRILYKLHDYERPRKVARFSSKKLHGKPYGEVVAEQLRQCLLLSFNNLDPSSTAYLRLERLASAILTIGDSLTTQAGVHRPVPRGLVAKALRAHRAFFGAVLEERCQYSLEPQSWFLAVTAAVTLWDNKL